MAKILVVDDSEVDRRLVGGLLDAEPDFHVEFAENGSDALRKMRDAVPDIVVTDLNMPEKDGLELVQAVRIHHAHVPVILMTAQGSESLAVKALEQGAASYVPKTHLSEKLLDTVGDVLSVQGTARSYERLIQCIERTEFDFVLENDVALIDPLIDLLQQIVHGMGLCDEAERFRVGIAIKEALLNAIYRGNLEISFEQMQEQREELITGNQGDLVTQRRGEQPYADRKVRVEVRVQPGEARFAIRDDGTGFDTNALVSGELGSLDPTAGRGIVLMRTFMDEVAFNETGNEVTLIKRHAT